MRKAVRRVASFELPGPFEQLAQTLFQLDSFFGVLRSFLSYAAAQVCFEFLPDEQSFELRKWELAETAGEQVESLTLQGWARIAALAQVEHMLAAQGSPHKPDDLAKFFGKAHISGMGTKSIEKALRVHRRMTAMRDPRGLQIISGFDERWGSHHALSSVNGLDAVCSKTFVKGNPAVSSALLLWTLETLATRMESGFMDPEDAKELIATINRGMLKKRIVCYLGQKVLVEAKKEAMKKAWQFLSSMQRWRESGLCTDKGWQATTWLAELPAYTHDTLSFLNRLLRGHPGLDEILDEFCRRDPLVSAELVMHAGAMKKMFDMEEMLEHRAEYDKQFMNPEPVVEAGEDETAPAAQGECEEEEMPALEDQDNPAPEVPTRLDRAAFFPSLAPLPDLVQDVLAKVEEDLDFERVLEWAKLRVSTFVNVHVGAPESWRARLTGLGLPDPSKTKWILYDAKREPRLPPKDLEQYPWKRTPSMDTRDLRLFLNAVSLGLNPSKPFLFNLNLAMI